MEECILAFDKVNSHNRIISSVVGWWTWKFV